MIRVLQNLPQKLFKTCHGGAYWGNRGQTVAETRRRGHQGTRSTVIVYPPLSRVEREGFHTSTQYEGLGGSQGGEESYSDWKKKKSFKHHAEWESYRRNSYCQEAVGWGSIIVVGLQLGRFIAAPSPGESRKRERREGLLSYVSNSLPSGPRPLGHGFPTRRGMFPNQGEGRRRQYNASSSQQQAEGKGLWDTELSDVPIDDELREFLKTTRPSLSSLSPHHRYTYSPLSSTTLTPPSSPSDPSFLTPPEVEATPPPPPPQSPSPTATTPNPRSSVAATLDLVTQHCWGQVNNMIGGHLMGEGEEEKAAHHFSLASKAGYSKGQYNLGICYELGKGLPQDLAQAALCFSSAAQQSHPQALYKLGTYHLDGTGDIKQCQQTAIQLITQAAAHDITQAESYLGVYYMTSDVRDAKRAVAYLQKAAHKKDPEAQYHLGLCYEFGWGVESNQAKAASLYHAAASKDHPAALYALGLFYEQGLGGLPENYLLARDLCTQASELGYEKATEKLTEPDSAEEFVSRPRLSSNSTGSTDSLISWLSSSEADSEGAEDLDHQLEDISSVESTPIRSAPKDSIWHVDSIHESSSAPELQETKAREGGLMTSLLHSLSCLTLVFPQLDQQGWTIQGSGGDPRRVGDTTQGKGRAARGDADDGRVKFQLGEPDEEDGLDWCEPLDTIAQRRLVTFNRAAAVV